MYRCSISHEYKAIHGISSLCYMGGGGGFQEHNSQVMYSYLTCERLLALYLMDRSCSRAWMLFECDDMKFM